ncbi:flagellar motor protein MotB [Thalassiella azotivora]
MSADRRRRGGHEEEHENHERWLVSYADMITVLMALFIVLYAMSQVDQAKYVELRNSLAQGFGNDSSSPVPGGTGLLEDSGRQPTPVQEQVGAAPQPIDLTGEGRTDAGRQEDTGLTQEQLRALAEAEVADLERVKAELEAALAAQGLGDRVRFRITERGLVAAVVADDVFFDSASAAIRPTGLRVLDTIAPVLKQRPEEIAVEGHANHLQITSSAVYPTNWELSAARAASVVRRLVDAGGLAQTRLFATGFSDTRPLYPPQSPEALAGNRRVDLVVVSQQPAQVRVLLPEIAAARATAQGG